MAKMSDCMACTRAGVSLTLEPAWPELYPYRPEVAVRMRYTDDALVVRFDVVERHVRALETVDNNPVCVDSCVEIFVMMSDGRNYANFESNPLGTLLAARRPTRSEKTPFDAGELAAVGRRGSCVGAAPFECRSQGSGDAEAWWVEIEIPFRLLGYDCAPRRLRLNMYKCGDCTDTRHYLSLFPIDSEKPDFHRPEFFGKIELL